MEVTLNLEKKESKQNSHIMVQIVFNPLMPRRTQVSPFTEISILFQEGTIKNISYERRAYESVEPILG